LVVNSVPKIVHGTVSTTKETYALPVFQAAFKEFGLPKGIRAARSVPCGFRRIADSR
jgi:hypothetical protein